MDKMLVPQSANTYHHLHFIYRLFNDAVSSSDVYRCVVRWIMKDELEMMWEEAVVA
jgi:hypothetical protein